MSMTDPYETIGELRALCRMARTALELHERHANESERNRDSVTKYEVETARKAALAAMQRAIALAGDGGAR